MTTEQAELNNLIDRFFYGDEKGKMFLNLKDYSKDWNLLMPVVEKIVDLGFIVEIPIAKSGTDVFIYNKQERLNITAYSKPIDALWNAIIQFIQWLNQNDDKQ